MNLIKFYTHTGTAWIDTQQLNNTGRRGLLTIRRQDGSRLSDTGRTIAIRESASYGIHHESLYASPSHAKADRERMIREGTQVKFT